MKAPIIHFRRAYALALCLLFAPSAQLHAQGGPLNPPGPPAPTMTTLSDISDQITGTQTSLTALKGDARTPITTTPFTITQSGSYYLTGNLSVASGGAIVIDADNVTLDLNGFTISSTNSTDVGIAIFLQLARKNIRIRNGHIVGTTTVESGVFSTGGFTGGIVGPSNNSRGIHISDICVSNIQGSGISIVNASPTLAIVENCTVNVCQGAGIQASTITNSIAHDCRTTAISGTTVTGCTGVSIGTDDTFHGISGTTVTNCTGTASGGIGITGSIVSFSRGRRDGGVAISASTAIGCTVLGSGTVNAAQKHLGTP